MSFDISAYESKMEKSLSNMREEFMSIRAGRANPHVLDKIQVDYYGTPTPIQGVANVSVPEARIIQIAPWDAGLMKDIEKAIIASTGGKLEVLPFIVAQGTCMVYNFILEFLWQKFVVFRKPKKNKE